MSSPRTHRIAGAVALGLGAVLLAPAAQAQFKVEADFRGSTAPGWSITGSNDRAPDISGRLTGGAGALTNSTGTPPAGLPPLPPNFTPITTNDPVGDGWLRLTTRLQNQVGTALYTGGRFPSNNGVLIEFDYVSWAGVTGMGADGISVFLFDANSPSAMTGNRHGAGLGYCNGAGGYLGIGIDEWGNFSSSQPQGVGSNGCDVGGNTTLASGGRAAGYSPNHIVVRGPTSAGNPYVAGVAPPAGQVLDDTYEFTRPTDIRRVRVRLLPKGSSGQGYRVQTEYGSAGGIMSNVFTQPLDFNYPAPSWLSIGFAASTGDLINFHEIRDVTVTGPADVGVTKTVSAASIPRGGQAVYTVVVSNNDINPYDPGNQSPLLTGSNPATFVDTLPTQLGNVTWTCAASAGSTCPAASGTGNINTKGYTLAEAGTLTFTITGTVGSEVQCGSTVTNTATVQFDADSDFTDLQPSDNSASAAFVVTCPQQAALSITKDNGKTSVAPGEQLTYSIQIANAGPDAANNAVIHDPAPTGMTCSTVTCGNAQGGAVCPAPAVLTVAALQSTNGVAIPTLPANSSLSLQIGCQVN